MYTRTIKTDRGSLERTWLDITVDEVGPNDWNDKADRAQLRQIIITSYPAATVNSNLVDNLFDISEYGIDSSQEHESVRVCWADVPKGMTKQQVEKQLKKYPNATIYRIMGSDISDVLTRGQLFAAYSPDYPNYDIDKAKKSHIVMAPQSDGSIFPITQEGLLMEQSVAIDANGKVTQILDETGLQYRATGFRLDEAEDIDKREKVARPKADAGMKEAVNADPAETIGTQ